MMPCSLVSTCRSGFATALLLGLAVTSSAQNAIRVYPGTSSRVMAAPNSSLVVPLILDMSAAGGENVASLSVTLAFAGQRLDSVRAGSFGTVSANGNRVSVFSATGTTSTVTVATLFFTTGTAGTVLSVTPTVAGNEAGVDILGKVFLRELPLCVSAGSTARWGDANADGTVNIIDAQQIARFTVGLSVLNQTELTARGDVNADNAVNIIDAQQVARFSVGLNASPRVNQSMYTPPPIAQIDVYRLVNEAAAGFYNPSAQLDFGKLELGYQAQIRPRVTDANGVDITGCVQLVYRSTDPSIATVSPEGVVTSIALGTTVVYVAADTTPGVAVTSSAFDVRRRYDFAVSGSPAAGGSVRVNSQLPSSSARVFDRDNVQAIATPNAGYIFVNWTEGGVVVSTSATYLFAAAASRTLVANFAAAVTIGLSQSPAGGSTLEYSSGFYDVPSGVAKAIVGSSVTVNARTNSGFNFVNWTEGSTVVSTSPRYIFTASANRSLVANFTTTPVSLVIDLPARNAIVTDTQTVTASIGPTAVIASATATIGSVVVPLVKANGRWSGLVNLSGQPHDTLRLVVTATDSSGNVATMERYVFHHLPPTLNVTAPADYGVANQAIGYAATCSADGGGAVTVTLAYVSQQLATGGSSFSGSVPASTLANRTGALPLTFTCVDKFNVSTSVIRNVYVENSAALATVGDANGNVIDYRAGKALSTPFSNTQSSTIRTFASGVEELIAPPTNNGIHAGFISPLGAILLTTTVYDWRNGSLTTAAAYSDALRIDPSATYATFGGGTGPILRRTLASGSDVTIGYGSAFSTSVAPDGSVAFRTATSNASNISWYRNGVTTALTSDTALNVRNDQPVTDGTNVVYYRTTCCTGRDQPYQIFLTDGVTTTLLDSRYADATMGSSYMVNNGWTAFTKLDASNLLQVWTRSPTGVLRKVSDGGSSIDALGDDGRVVYHTDNRRYLASPTGTPGVVSSSQGNVVWRAGEFYLLIGRSVLHIQP